jgi:HEAT repeat protein
MPESEKRELGELARSIDALFSQARPVAPAEEPSVEAEEAGAETLLHGEPDPFESLEAYARDIEAIEPVDEPEPVAELPEEPEATLSFAGVEVPQEVGWEALEEGEAVELIAEVEAVEERVAEPAAIEAEVVEEVVEVEPDLETEHTSGPEPVAETEPEPMVVAEPEPAPGPAGPSLAELVEAYLAGEPDAADQVRAESATLQERMALDPLADAVEALVHSNGDAPSEDALALAQAVMNPAVASRLVQRMGHEDDDEKRRGYVVLSQRLGTVMAKSFRGALTDSTDPRARRTFYDALIAMGDTSRPMIEAMVEDDNRFLVRNAVAMLGEMGGDRAVELVTSALANTDARVRREALKSLAKLGGDESGQLVTGFLEDPDAEVRAAAASAAGTLRLERALKPILGLLEDESDPEVLVELLGSLGRLGDPGAVQAIEKRAVGSLFSKPVTEVRVAAYRALHDIGTPHARELIAKATDDKDPVVRTMARQLAPAG